MLPHLFEAISSKKLPPADRIGLLSDGAALSKAGLMPFGRFLELLGAYKNEDDATVWSQLLEKLMSLGKILRGGRCNSLSEAYDGFARSLIVPVLERCGWAPRDEDAHLTRKLRGEVIAALPTFCAADDGVYAEAKRRFDAFRAGDDAALPSEYQSAVYKLVLACAGNQPFYELREAHERSSKCLLVGDRRPVDRSVISTRSVLARGGRETYDQILELREARPLNEEKKSCLVGLAQPLLHPCARRP